MKQLARVTRFEIPAEKPERAVEFYRKVFDWKIEKWQGPIQYFLINTENETDETGINGAIHESTNFKTTVNIVSVFSIDQTLEKVVQSGGKIIIPKSAVPGGGYIAYALDTEGNAIGIFENSTPPNALLK